jgi:hypothetical protein
MAMSTASMMSMEAANDKAKFWELLQMALPTMQVFDPRAAAGGWWVALKGFSFEQAEKAITRLLQLGKKAPVPADAIAIITEELELLWLGADEAWAVVLVLTDENRSAFTTDAIDEACQNLNELIASDPIAGRMAFKSAYERTRKMWTAQGRIPKVRFAAGNDKAEREDVVKTALKYGGITHEQAQHYLPAPKVAATDLIRIAQDNIGKNPEAENVLAGLKSMLGIGEHVKQQKWRTPDRVWEEGGVMYVKFGDEVKRLDELEDRKAA